MVGWLISVNSCVHSRRAIPASTGVGEQDTAGPGLLSLGGFSGL